MIQMRLPLLLKGFREKFPLKDLGYRAELKGMSAQKKRILLAVSGSIAAYRSVDFARDLLSSAYDVEVVLSESAKSFVGETAIETFLGKPCLSNKVFDSSHVGTDHIRWARWADAIVLYGASANRLAQLSQGFGNDMINLQLLAFKGKVLLAPAMNPAMWEHPAVAANVKALQDRGYFLSGPISGKVACGETGVGHLQVHTQILSDLESLLKEGASAVQNSKRVLISAGPMRSQLDAVRFLQNSSSGLTGLYLAQEFFKLGYQVNCLLGPIEASLREKFSSFDCEDYVTASDYRKLLDKRFPYCDLFVSAAAVLDFELQTQEGKMTYNKADHHLGLEVVPVEDFVASVCRAKKAEQKVLAFALQTGTPEQQLLKAREKLKTKDCDLIVLNSAQEGLGPMANQGSYSLLYKGSLEPEELGLLSKAEFAARLVRNIESTFLR
ncbi:bifunctional phosphopantothenoylcysteine decarboxylase/phosphopantothenate--cysteine ligase CoaBC [bacterium]|nr:bifunctional phosphopantothenoylcysteine decarboxylase/phosphopantothenate--cysteine ligase CoaBC [bacterium]